MALKLGAYTACLHDRPLGEALDVRFPDDFLEGVHTYGDLTNAVRVSLGP